MIARLWAKYGPQFVRFFIVGVGATLLHWGVYICLNILFGLSDEQKIALLCTSATGYIISFIANYFVSLKWTFKTEGNLKKGLGFGFSHGVNFGMQAILQYFFLWLGTGELIIRLLNDYTPWLTEAAPKIFTSANMVLLPVFIIVIPINFLMVRFFLTRDYK